MDEVGPEPVILAKYPRFVCRLTRRHALAYCADALWSKFLVICGGRVPEVSVFARTQAGFVEQALESSRCGDAGILAHALEIRHCLLATDDQVSPAFMQQIHEACEVRRLDGAAVAAGASAYALVLAGKDGVSTNIGDSVVMRTVRRVEYSVLHPERAVFDAEESTLDHVVSGRSVLLVADAKVAELYGPHWNDYARRRLHLSGEVLLPVCERSKELAQVEKICAFAACAGLPRDGLIVGLGGGVTLDIAGLAAAVFRRGIGYIRIPTTLVALADVAVGIKTGVNAYGKKNLIGAFHPPVASINDYRFLRTLPADEIACGMAEILKVALIRDAFLFELIEKHGQELIRSSFGRPAEIARAVVGRAELLMMEELAPNLFEDTLARLVDFGHTFSPAFEVCSEYEMKHGHAVALDMLLSTSIAVVCGLADVRLLDRLFALFPKLGLPVWDEQISEVDVLMQAVEDTRRHRGGSLNLVVVTQPGSAMFIQNVSLTQVESAVNLVRRCALVAQSAACQRFEGYARAAV